MSDLVLHRIDGSQLSTHLEQLTTEARSLVEASLSPNTRRAYLCAWKSFAAWCAAEGVHSCPAPPELVVLYIAKLAGTGHKVPSINTALAAIAHVHTVAGHPSPCNHPMVRKAKEGAKRKLGTAPTKKRAAIGATIQRMIDAQSADLSGDRNRALLLLGFSGAFRRSELCGLMVEDIVDDDAGLRVTIRRSKTDQTGRGYTLGIPYDGGKYCPVTAVRTWLQSSGISSGFLFRSVDRWGNVSQDKLSPGSVASVVKSACESVGLDPAAYSGHSLRSGFITTATRAKKNYKEIMGQSRHKSVSVFFDYVQTAELFENNPASGLLEEEK